MFYYVLNTYIKPVTIQSIGTGADPNKPPCKKAKDLRRERWAQKQAQKQTTTQGQENNKKKQNEPKNLEDFLSEVKSDPAHKLEVNFHFFST